MSSLHKSAQISSDAKLGQNISVGPGAVIEGGVTIGDDCRIGSNTLIAEGARLGRGVTMFHGSVVGSIPQDLKFGGEDSEAIIGDGTVLREYATVNRGTAESGSTSLGKNCFIMSYAHVAHDCHLGNNVIMANSVNLAGHIEIDDFAILGGLVPVHQFVHIGAHCMVGGGFRIPKDICPYALVGGYPIKVIGMNSIGLKRRGFEKDAIRTLEKAFKILFFSKLNTSQAIERIKSEIEPIAEIKVILDFIARSKRGLAK